MDSPRRHLLLPAVEIFSGFDGDKRQWRSATFSDDPPEFRLFTATDDDRKLFLSHCAALLAALGLQPCSKSIDLVADHIAGVSNNCYRAGLRQSAIAQARKAQAAKKRKSDARGRIVQRAIIAVSERQKVSLVASEKFATSIRSEVIAAASQFGLADVRAGTSTRSIQRHIAVLLKLRGDA